MTINLAGHLLELDHPVVMGILNCTPDSFFSASRKQTEAEIAQRAHQIVEQGGKIIDIGAYSTRPGATEVDEAEELRRLVDCLTVVRRELPDAILSLDTFRPSVARMCVERFGVSIINDVSEGTDDQMFPTVAQLRVAYVLMSTQPTMESTLMAFAKKVNKLRELGVGDIILDPGFGFGKTLDDNFRLMSQLERLHAMGLPLLVGISRKSMIWRKLNISPDEALNGTSVLNTVALQKGAQILRVHDVREAVEAVRLVEELRSAT